MNLGPFVVPPSGGTGRLKPGLRTLLLLPLEQIEQFRGGSGVGGGGVGVGRAWAAEESAELVERFAGFLSHVARQRGDGLRAELEQRQLVCARFGIANRAGDLCKRRKCHVRAIGWG